MADLEKAGRICLDAKTQYPSACNAAETLLVDSEIAGDFLPEMVEIYQRNGVEVRGDDPTRALAGGALDLATEEELGEAEYLDMVISVKVGERHSGSGRTYQPLQQSRIPMRL